ncbi:MAG TPA: hypothetical protein VGM23_01075, partial [Armatimonadota bacterium]
FFILTVPILFLIALIEALAIRSMIHCTFWRMVWLLLLINLATTCLGFVYYFGRFGTWGSLLITYLGTTLLEWLLLFRIKRDLQDATPRGLFLASLRMNTASYGAIALLLLYFFLPSWLNNDPHIRREISGTLRVFAGFSIYTLDIDRNTGAIMKHTAARPQWTAELEDVLQAGLYQVQLEKQRIKVTLRGQTKPIYTLPFKTADIRGRCLSRNGRYLLYSTGEASQVIDLSNGKQTPVGPYDIKASFSPAGTILAIADHGIVAYNYRTGEKKKYAITGSIDSSPAVSPDGNYVAYLGRAVPHATSYWFPEVRVLRLRDGKTATIYPRIFTSGRLLSNSVVWE